MKIYKLFIFALIGIFLLGACDSNEEIQFDDPTVLSSKSDKTVTVPFKADLYTVRDYSLEGGFPPVSTPPYCTDFGDPDYEGFNHQVGEGEGTHLGKFSVVINFCGATTDAVPPGSYAYGTGILTAANGDELWIEVAGEVIFLPPGSDPVYEAYFNDPFVIVGGTGRFKGATGGGMTYSMVDLFVDGLGSDFIPEHRTDHVFSGEITLMPGAASVKD